MGVNARRGVPQSANWRIGVGVSGRDLPWFSFCPGRWPLFPYRPWGLSRGPCSTHPYTGVP
jgi:hypothetical protein